MINGGKHLKINGLKFNIWSQKERALARLHYKVKTELALTKTYNRIYFEKISLHRNRYPR